MKNYQQQRTNILKNVKALQTLYGTDSDIIINNTQPRIIVYGILNKGKTFYSVDTRQHKEISSIAKYHKSVTISFLSDLSKELMDIITPQPTQSQLEQIGNKFSFNPDWWYPYVHPTI